MEVAQISEGYTDVKFGVRHDIANYTAEPESRSTIGLDDERVRDIIGASSMTSSG